MPDWAAFALALPALSSARGRGGRRLLLAHALVAVGMLAKGPVILAPLRGAARPRGAARAAPRAARAPPPRRVRRARPPARGALVRVHGVAVRRDYVRDLLRPASLPPRDLRRRGRARPPWYYLQALAGDAQPWLLLRPVGAVRGGAARATGVRRRCSRGSAPRSPWCSSASRPVSATSTSCRCYPMLAAALAPLLARAATTGSAPPDARALAAALALGHRPRWSCCSTGRARARARGRRARLRRLHGDPRRRLRARRRDGADGLGTSRRPGARRRRPRPPVRQRAPAPRARPVHAGAAPRGGSRARGAARRRRRGLRHRRAQPHVLRAPADGSRATRRSCSRASRPGRGATSSGRPP